MVRGNMEEGEKLNTRMLIDCIVKSLNNKDK